MKSYKNIIAAIMLSLATSLPVYAFDLALGNEEKSLGIKVTHEVDEPFGKPLPWGPASVRFSDNSLWAADTLKNRIDLLRFNKGAQIGELIDDNNKLSGKRIQECENILECIK